MTTAHPSDRILQLDELALSVWRPDKSHQPLFWAFMRTCFQKFPPMPWKRVHTFRHMLEKAYLRARGTPRWIQETVIPHHDPDALQQWLSQQELRAYTLLILLPDGEQVRETLPDFPRRDWPALLAARCAHHFPNALLCRGDLRPVTQESALQLHLQELSLPAHCKQTLTTLETHPKIRIRTRTTPYDSIQHERPAAQRRALLMLFVCAGRWMALLTQHEEAYFCPTLTHAPHHVQAWLEYLSDLRQYLHKRRMLPLEQPLDLWLGTPNPECPDNTLLARLNISRHPKVGAQHDWLPQCLTHSELSPESSRYLSHVPRPTTAPPPERQKLGGLPRWGLFLGYAGVFLCGYNGYRLHTLDQALAKHQTEQKIAAQAVDREKAQATAASSSQDRTYAYFPEQALEALAEALNQDDTIRVQRLSWRIMGAQTRIELQISALSPEQGQRLLQQCCQDAAPQMQAHRENDEEKLLLEWTTKNDRLPRKERP